MCSMVCPQVQMRESSSKQADDNWAILIALVDLSPPARLPACVT